MPAYRESYLLRIDCDPVLRAWTSVGDLAIPADAIEPIGATYRGAGEITGLPNIRMLLNGIAERLDITVSGVNPETLRLAREDAESVKGAAAYIGLVIFDDSWQVAEVDWLWEGRADFIEVTRLTAGEGKRLRGVKLSLGSIDTGRSRASLAFFTDADQRRRSSDDAIFSHVASMSGGVTRRFGPKA